jgi:hypothetical protein
MLESLVSPLASPSHSRVRTINWQLVTPASPPEQALIAITGWYQGKPGAGRWIAFARRVGPKFFSDETGEELFPPTHWHEVIFPDD